MTLAKITVSGTVVKNPEKRFTQNNLAITSFVMDANPQDETLVRVFALGNLADKAADMLKMGDTVLVDGRLQTANAKTTNGKERKIIEINASSVDKISILSEGGNSGYSSYSQNSAPAAQAAPQTMQPAAQAPAQPAQKEIVQFAVDEISEDLIDEDEIPF
ncbi:MAG: single-stranded DNA-binding protein [Candidatus Gastranaerophilales bacterium]|nr:single-stranded DNA-binding protein [Candidatus Gastranaerophilales bacterium]